MIAQNSATKTRTISSFYLFAGLAVILVVLAVILAGAFSPVTSSSTSTQNQFRTYTNNHYGYTIAYPTSWKVIDQPGDEVFTAASSVTSNDERGGTNFSQRKLLEGVTTPTVAFNFSKVDVVAYDLDSQMSAHDFLLAKTTTAPEGAITDLKVAGQDAVKVEVQPGQVLENHQDVVTYTSVFVTSGKRGFIIAGFASPSVFNHIIESFQTIN